MIVVDTSVWIAAFRSGQAFEAIHLKELLESGAVALAVPVRIEILAGASNRDRPRLRQLLSALPLLLPSDSTWQRIDDWLDRAGRAGQRFGFADLLIAALAAGSNASIWTLDTDFARMSALKFVAVHAPN